MVFYFYCVAYLIEQNRVKRCKVFSGNELVHVLRFTCSVFFAVSLILFDVVLYYGSLDGLTSGEIWRIQSVCFHTGAIHGSQTTLNSTGDRTGP